MIMKGRKVTAKINTTELTPQTIAVMPNPLATLAEL
jgi:hypothetical protein